LCLSHECECCESKADDDFLHCISFQEMLIDFDIVLTVINYWGNWCRR
jgi:hypothetical protein